MRPARAISGHVFRVDGKRRPVWRAKYRLPDGRQVQRTIGPVWTERGRPPEGYFTKRTAEAWLREVLDQAERGVLPGMVRTGRAFAEAAEEYLRYLADDRQRKPSTVRDARSVIRNHLLPPFGARAVEDITEDEVERWVRRLGADRPLSNATKRKVIVIFHGVMARACRVYRLPVNPVAKVEKPRLAAPGAIDVFSPEEVHALGGCLPWFPSRRSPGSLGAARSARSRRAPRALGWRHVRAVRPSDRGHGAGTRVGPSLAHTDVAISSAFLDRYDTSDVRPEPLRVKTLADAVVFTFAAAPRGRATFFLQPKDSGWQRHGHRHRRHIGAHHAAGLSMTGG
jgi:hypothetical protein